MLTATGRKHVIRAVSKAALINRRKAAEIVDTIRNTNAVTNGICLKDVTGSVGMNANDAGTVSLWIPKGGDDYDWVGTIQLPVGTLRTWSTASLARAYGCDDETTAWYEAELEEQFRRLGAIPPSPFALDLAA